MTIKETGVLERLRNELHAYHVDVMQQAIELKTVSEEVGKMQVDLYGTPGDKKTNPGALADVTKLCGSRRRMLIGLRGLWVVITLVLGAIITWVVRG